VERLAIVAIGLVILGLFWFARLALSDDMRALDWHSRLARTFFAAALVCFGAAELPRVEASSRNTLAALGALLGGGVFVALLLARREKRTG
jgi:UDP-N-acetylmuramyl pentapeptide phosphotransferase/UDP-N-acetylglucosamine-1-phosphate transferase